ncbi:AraC-type DNA-binding protein [Georgenia satyanarayanai]|uniref:AraC-type DNA-binding protein n=2 Tax=Georgenia satyanarayanai TaxID=860221 RepID=A0A2Y9APS4_9MICO|nr:AraC-like DNA-binding protein [Georgenia satyanarayanai]SSA46481.1 AraC-type DNA-binding protein [Georgenia satyanarayanai]
MRGTFYCRAQLTAPWALRMPAVADAVSFHVLTAGTCWVSVPGLAPVELRAGELALVPHGRGHDLLSAPGSAPPRRVERLPQDYLTEHYSVLRHGGGGPATQLVCGVVGFDEPLAHELVRALPPVVLADGASTVRDTVRLMAEELSHLRPGGEVVATRLADILVVQGIRGWLERDPAAREGWLRALDDERVGRVLEAVHAEPGLPWTLDRLAGTAAMSRSSFASRFAALVGETPMAYVTRWRMLLAQTRLAQGDTTVAALATELGYRSEAAFSRAFTRTVGRTPGAVRRGSA